MTDKEKIKQFDDCKEVLKRFVGCTVICYVGKVNNALAIRTVFNHYKLVDYDKIGFELKKSDDETLFIPTMNLDKASLRGASIRILYDTDDIVSITILAK